MIMSSDDWSRATVWPPRLYTGLVDQGESCRERALLHRLKS